MAVGRIVLSERLFERAAQAADSVPGLRRAARELRRAAQRPGKQAELTDEELISLAACELDHAVGVEVYAARDAALRSREREDARTAAVRQRLDARRGRPSA